MSSLTYHAEHLAWQQRIHQEKSRSSNFYKTIGNFSSFDASAMGTRSIFPKASVDENPINYRALKHSLGYTFGGTKPVRYSLYDQSSVSKSPQKLRERVREASQDVNPYLKSLDKELEETKRKCENQKNIQPTLAYAKKLEEKLINERKKRIKAEIKLKG
jgi:hypothetical protein